MTAFAENLGLHFLSQFDLDTLGKFRATWKDGPRTASKKLERLRAFFRFAHDRQWVEVNPAGRIKLPKIALRPTMPLTREEMVRILAACDGLQVTTPVEGKFNAHRLKTLVLLLRYTGMRASDAVTLTTDRLDGKRLFLYTQKTGVPVYTILPDSVLRALETTPRVTDTHYFWSGQGKRESVVCHWQMRLNVRIRSGQDIKGPRQRRFAPLPRYFRSGAVACRCANRAGVDSFRPLKRARNREALQPMGAFAARAA
jgi:integrase